MRLRAPRALFVQRPFQGAGASLYATIGTRVQYRHACIPHGRFLKGKSGVFDFGAASVEKTARLASVDSPTAEISFPVPAAWHSQTVTFDVRTFAADVENESDNYRTRVIEFDAGGVPVVHLAGSGRLLELEKRDGGGRRFRFVWQSSRVADSPTLFRITQTAGPGSLADITVAFVAGRREYEATLPDLTDGESYTFQISAENGAAAILLDSLTPGDPDITFTADAAGPPEVTGASLSEW